MHHAVYYLGIYVNYIGFRLFFFRLKLLLTIIMIFDYAVNISSWNTISIEVPTKKYMKLQIITNKNQLFYKITKVPGMWLEWKFGFCIHWKWKSFHWKLSKNWSSTEIG